MSKVTVEEQYLGHSFKLTLESDVSEDLAGVDEKTMAIARRAIRHLAENTVVALNDKKAAEEFARAGASARQAGKVLVDATVGRKRSFAVVEKDSVGPSVILGAGGKETERRMVVGKDGQLLRSKPGTAIEAAEEAGGNQ